MASPPPDVLGGKSGADVADSPGTADIKAETALRPFLQTCFGRLPPEIREKVFVGLLATPPPYASHDFATSPSEPKVSRKAPGRFVHIEASWYQVTRTCRQIYRESRPIFFASKSYYFANHQDLARFLRYSNFARLSFRSDTITALCVRDLVKTKRVYTQEHIDEIFSDPNIARRVYRTRQEYEARTCTEIDFSLSNGIRCLKSLRTVGLCIRVGEEMEYVSFVHGLSGIRKGLVEFKDASHWLIRSQNPGDPWRIQYACFTNGDYARGKDNENIPYAITSIELAVTDIDSRAPGLQEGDERYVEVQIQRHTEDKPSQSRLNESGSGIVLETTSDNSDLELQAQPEIPQDQSETSAGKETAEEDASETGLEPEQDRADQPSILVVQSEESPGHQSLAVTNQEEDHTFETQSKTQSDHQTEDPPSSRSYVSAARSKAIDTGTDRNCLTDADDEDSQAQPNTRSGNQAPQLATLQQNNRVHAENATGADHTRKDLEEKIQEPDVSTTIKISLIKSKYSLLDIADTPNPLTEEEMISYYGDPRQGERPISRFWSTQEHPVNEPGAASETATRKTETPSPASPNRSALQSRSVQIGAVSLFFLLLVVLQSGYRTSGEMERDQASNESPLWLR